MLKDRHATTGACDIEIAASGSTIDSNSDASLPHSISHLLREDIAIVHTDSHFS